MAPPTRREILQATGGGFGLAGIGQVRAGNRGAGKGRGSGKGRGGNDGDDTYWPNDKKPAYSIGFTHDVDLPQERGRADEVFYSWDWGPFIGKTVVGMFGKGQLRRFRNRDDVRYVSKVMRPTMHHGSHADWGDCPHFKCCGWDYANDEICCYSSFSGSFSYPKDDGSSWTGQCEPWGIDRIGAPSARSAGHTGSGADIAILDTGVDLDHPDLVDNVTTPHWSTSTSDPGDGDGHGTHVAGLAAAADTGAGTVGVAPDANIHAADIFEAGGSSGDVADAIRWAADENFDVINLSVGFSDSSGDCSGGVGEFVPEVHDACVYAYYGHDADSDTTQPDPTKGLFIAASAGNDGTGDCDTTSDPPQCCGNSCSCICPPGAYHAVQTVAATGYDPDADEDYHAAFSSCGPQVDITAPGKLVASTYCPECDSCDESNYSGCGSDAVDDPAYARISGTSMSSPIVAGAAAVLMAQGYTAEQAKQVMNRTAQDIGLSEDMQGHGLLDIGAASGATYSGGLLVVNDRPEVDSTNGEVTLRGQFMGASPSEVDQAGFRMRRRYDNGAYDTGEWSEVYSVDPSAEQFDATVDIEAHDTSGDGDCHAYEYQAFVETSDDSDRSKGLAFWNDPCCLGDC